MPCLSTLQAASDIIAPVSCEVIDANSTLADDSAQARWHPRRCRLLLNHAHGCLAAQQLMPGSCRLLTVAAFLVLLFHPTRPQVNGDPYGAGWMVKVKLTEPAELDALMDAKAYEKFCA